MYIKCPRCMLNYINEETEQYCKVCLVDMGKIQGQPELELDDDYKLCPECNENYLEEGEDLCYACRIKHMAQDNKDDDSIDDYEDDDMLPETVEDSLEVMAEMENEESDSEEDEEE
ncbi:MAG: hypothetical protein E7365_07135 [Clostridiales bacterium]|nr:hypothetical protein [Clostridiales bacterium]